MNYQDSREFLEEFLEGFIYEESYYQIQRESKD